MYYCDPCRIQPAHELDGCGKPRKQIIYLVIPSGHSLSLTFQLLFSRALTARMDTWTIFETGGVKENRKVQLGREHTAGRFSSCWDRFMHSALSPLPPPDFSLIPPCLPTLHPLSPFSILLNSSPSFPPRSFTQKKKKKLPSTTLVCPSSLEQRGPRRRVGKIEWDAGGMVGWESDGRGIGEERKGVSWGV